MKTVSPFGDSDYESFALSNERGRLVLVGLGKETCVRLGVVQPGPSAA
jgi:hypothetical protein